MWADDEYEIPAWAKIVNLFPEAQPGGAAGFRVLGYTPLEPL